MSAPQPSRSPRSPWLVLAVLAVAQFIDTLDVTIVNVGLPHIRSSLHFSADGIQWVISAYTLMYGGFLLLGGRLADVIGRRTMLIAGLSLFGISSLAAGLAPGSTEMIIFRGLQGLGGAMIAPAALSLLTVTFPSGRERNIALGVWGSLAGLGGTFGVILGGALIDALSWRWIFLVNVPIIAVLVAVTPLLINESRAELAPGARRADWLGAVLGTGGLLTLVLAIVRTEPLGFGSPEVLGLLAAGAALLAAFVRVEQRAGSPLLPLAVFRSRSLTVSVTMLAINGAGFLAMFFLTATYLQDVLHLSALRAGIDFVPMGVAAVAAAIAVSQLVTRVGTRPVQFGGAVLTAAGLLLLAQSQVQGSYASQLLPGLILFGAGILAIGIPTQIAATSDVQRELAGVASGVITTAWQIGGALGLAIVTTLTTSHVTAQLHAGHAPISALASGYHYGLAIAAGLAVVNGLLAFAAPRLRPTAEMVAAAAV